LREYENHSAAQNIQEWSEVISRGPLFDSIPDVRKNYDPFSRPWFNSALANWEIRAAAFFPPEETRLTPLSGSRAGPGETLLLKIEYDRQNVLTKQWSDRKLLGHLMTMLESMSALVQENQSRDFLPIAYSRRTPSESSSNGTAITQSKTHKRASVDRMFEEQAAGGARTRLRSSRRTHN